MSQSSPHQKALLLSYLTVGYNILEGALSIFAGALAGSIALVGFGLDSVIELAAAAVLLWRLRLERAGADEETVAQRERWVHLFVGVTFLLLAAYVGFEAIWTLRNHEAAAESIVGIILAAASLVLMPLIAWGKLRAATEIGSGALRAEAKETLACSYLSFTLLLGLVCNAAAGWWWADPLAALLMVPWLVREGIEGIRGEDDE